MKHFNLFYFLILLSSLTLITSCEDEDDTNTTNPEVVLTESNYIYESNMYKQYLEDQQESLQIEIDYLQGIIDNNQGTQETIDQLNAAQEQYASNEEVIGLLPSFPIGGVPIPPPPPPCSVATCIPIDEFSFFVCDAIIEELQITIYTSPEEQLISTGNTELQILPNSDEQTKYLTLSLSELGYTGSVLVQVNKTTVSGEQMSYTVEGYLRP